MLPLIIHTPEQVAEAVIDGEVKCAREVESHSDDGLERKAEPQSPRRHSLPLPSTRPLHKLTITECLEGPLPHSPAVPSPEEDDYSVRLASVLRLKANPSPKVRECCELLRSVSSLKPVLGRLHSRASEGAEVIGDPSARANISLNRTHSVNLPSSTANPCTSTLRARFTGSVKKSPERLSPLSGTFASQITERVESSNAADFSNPLKEPMSIDKDFRRDSAGFEDDLSSVKSGYLSSESSGFENDGSGPEDENETERGRSLRGIPENSLPSPSPTPTLEPQEGLTKRNSAIQQLPEGYPLKHQDIPGTAPDQPGKLKAKEVSSSNGWPKKPRLILHMDINKTVLVHDTAQDAGSDSMVNVLLSECAWGRLLPGPTWIPVGRLATDRPVNDPELMTYRSFLDTFWLPFRRGLGPEVDHANEEIKYKRQALKRSFTSPGQPGAMFRGVYDQLIQALQVPAGLVDEMKSREIGDGVEIVMLPSFFDLLKHLQRIGRDFAIVFRTFGNDLLDVAKEMNHFCKGMHPLHPNVAMDGSDGKTDLRLESAEQFGCFFRSGFNDQGTLLAMAPPNECLGQKLVRLEALDAADCECYTSFREIYDGIKAHCSPGNVALALRDYYPWWKAHQERARTGKLLLVDPKDPDTRHIFFDDNIGSGSAHIVDVRDVNTGQPIPFSESNGRYLVKVEPLNAILDRQYFIRAVHRCEEAIEMRAPESRVQKSLNFKRSKWSIARSRVMSIVRLSAED